MTLLDDPPVVTESSTVRPTAVTAQSAAWRFAARLARRETRRRPGRTVLASLLIAVPVAAMTIGSVFARTENGDWSAQFERRYGDADIAVDAAMFASTFEDNGPVELPAATVTTEYLWVRTPIVIADADSGFTYASVTDIDLSDPSTGSPIEVTSGDLPEVGELLLSQNLAAALDVSVGDDLTFERPSGTWTVSGFGRLRDSYYDDAIVIPGFDRERIAPGYMQSITLYDLPDGMSHASIEQLAGRLGGITPTVDPYGGFNSNSRFTRGMAWGWVAGALALVAVGIIVAAAFATSARRQLVTIGQLTANGATPRVVRRTLALQGTWTGLVGSAVGIGIGLASLPFISPVIARVILQHDVSPFRVSVGDLVIIALTATVAGTVAAAVPARSASRIPVMSALAGRRPLGHLPKWLVPSGLLLLAAGLGLVAIASLGINGSSSGRSDDVWALLIVLGVVGVVFGMCCATPLVIERVGGLGRHTSLSWRLALRSLGRSRTRSSAVIAAIAVAVGGSVAAGAIVETSVREDANSWTPTLPADAIVIDSYQFIEGSAFDTDPLEPILDLDALPPAPLADDVRERLLSIVPDATIVPLRVATIDPAPFNTETGNSIWPEPAGPRIADPALLDVLGLSKADLDALERSGSLRPVGQWELANPGQYGIPEPLRFVGADGLIEFEPTAGTSPYGYEYAGWGQSLITPAFAEQLGFDIVERGAIVRSPEALTEGQRDRLFSLREELVGAERDAFIEPGDPPRLTDTAVSVTGEQLNVSYDEPRSRFDTSGDLWIARLVILGAVVLISLLVVSIGLSLAAAEGRDEHNVLAVVGATPASMRRQAAARASVLALSGIALGIPTGFLPAWVLYSTLNSGSAISTEPLRFPWLVAGSLIVLVPMLVAGVAWIGAGVGQRFRPPTPARRD